MGQMPYTMSSLLRAQMRCDDECCCICVMLGYTVFNSSELEFAILRYDIQCKVALLLKGINSQDVFTK